MARLAAPTREGNIVPSIVVQIRDQIDGAVNDAKQVADTAAAAEKAAEQGVAALTVAAEHSSRPAIGHATGKLRQSKQLFNKASQATTSATQVAQRWAQGL